MIHRKEYDWSFLLFGFLLKMEPEWCTIFLLF
jgi:hypothetical protein